MGIGFYPAPVTATPPPALPTGEPGQILVADQSGDFVPTAPPPALPAGAPGQILVADQSGDFVAAAPPPALPTASAGQALEADATGTFRSVTPPWGGGDHYRSGHFSYGAYAPALTGITTTLNMLCARPFLVTARRQFDRIGIYNQGAGTAGAIVRLGLYAYAGGAPGSLMLDAGTVDTTTTGHKEIVVSLTLSPGLYFVAQVSQVATCMPTHFTTGSLTAWMMVTTLSGSGAYQTPYINGVTGALPSAWSGTLTITSSVPGVALRAV